MNAIEGRYAMDWMKRLRSDPQPWLLEPDAANPGVRYLALRDLLDRPVDHPDSGRPRPM